MTEVEIRNKLIAALSATPEGVGAAFISEMFVAQFSRRADLVMANGRLSAFEIKSPLDSLDRLDGQIETYLRYFELVTVVCADKHLSEVNSRIPDCVGIRGVRSDGQIYLVRSAQVNSSMGKENWLSFLPVDELRAFLRLYGSIASGARVNLVNAALTQPYNTIREYVLSYLKRRDRRVGEIILKKKRARVAPVVEAFNQSERLSAFLRHSVAVGKQSAAIPRKVA